MTWPITINLRNQLFIGRKTDVGWSINSLVNINLERQFARMRFNNLEGQFARMRFNTLSLDLIMP